MNHLARILSAFTLTGIVSAAGATASAEPARAPEPNSVDELVVLAEQVKVQDPDRYAVMGPEVDRIVRNQKVATAGLVGAVAGGAISAFFAQSMRQEQDKCDENPDAFERADCHDDALDDNGKFIYLGGAVFLAGTIAYLVASPSKGEIREAARNAPWVPRPTVGFGVSVDREGKGAVAGVSGTF
jgi:hypothetical protein